MTTPPLPLINGALHIDNSFLELLQTCPRALEYKQLRKREIVATRVGMNFGTALHLALDWRYRTYGADLQQHSIVQCEQEQSTILEQYFSANPCPEDDHRGMNWAMDLVKRYNVRYQVEQFNLLRDDKGPIVEVPFAVRFGLYLLSGKLIPANQVVDKDLELPHIWIFYTGKIDLPISWDGSLFIMDHKTTSVLGQSFWDDLRISPQQLGYCWAYKQLTGQQPIGFVVNAIRTNLPPLKPIKQTIAQWWEDSLSRMKEYITTTHLDEWHRNTFALVEEFLWHHSRSFMPQKKKWCVGKYGKCAYYEVCYAPEHQRDELLKSEAFTDYDWSPLKGV